MIRFKMFMVAFIGSVLSWLLVKTALIDMNFLQFLAIEFIVGFAHYAYNDIKLRLQE